MNSIELTKTEKEKYVASGIEEFFVDEEKYTAFDNITFFWEKTNVKSPERTNSGAMGDINNMIATFVTPHFTVHYDLMPINDFRRIMKQFIGKTNAGENGKTEFSVTVYDPIYNKVITKRMYLGTPNTPTYWTETLDDGRVCVLGVQNYTLEFIGTNND